MGGQYRSDPERHRRQVRRINRALVRATRRLREAHWEEWKTYRAEELALEPPVQDGPEEEETNE